MQATSTDRPIERVIAAIQALDLDPIKLKLMDAEEGQGWSREHADHMELGYKRFLTLLATHPEETLAPSRDVDKFWHGHILDTLKYAEDCDKVFGYFLHHFPYFGMRGAEDAANLARAAETTQRLYRQEFGSAQSDGAAKSEAAAFCGATKEGAAFCGAAKESAAFCGAAKQAAAFCGAAKESVAFCGATKQDAAFCGAAKENVAFCGATRQDAAFCGTTKRAAFCGAATERAVRKETARSASSELKVSVRPTLPAAGVSA